MNERLFIFGAGYSGRAIAREALEQGAGVYGTTRSPEKAEELRALGMEAHLFDGSSLSPWIAEALWQTTHLVVSIAPGENDPVLAAARDVIAGKMPALRWIGYLSTVGVYGDHQGAWVDEDAECRPVSARSRERLEAERQWLALGKEADIPVAVLRLSGIYGPGRNALLNLENGTARRIIKKDQIFNRIHVEDIAGVALFLARRERGGVFNVTDSEPSPPQDVIAYAASMMGVEPPPEVAFEEIEMTPMARSFWGESKRVSNARAEAEGYRFRFPNYRAALDHMWQAGTWRNRR